ATSTPQSLTTGAWLATQFGGRPFSCSVPWSGVVQVFDPEQKAAVLAWLFPVQEAAEEAGDAAEPPEQEPDEGAGDGQESAKADKRAS
ncbi:hypothetical protein GY658_26085, partial [Escherichia coli]|uniref:ClpXP protease specificity-enhancing factor SspB n=1 Tax=Escherichia coli TaxID=562 RepID=UPI0017FAFB7E